MKYLKLFQSITANFLPKAKESQILLGIWKVHDNEKLKHLSMSNSNKDNCSFNHNISLEELVVMTHNNSKPTNYSPKQQNIIHI